MTGHILIKFWGEIRSMNIAICEDEEIYLAAMQLAVSEWQNMRGYTDITTRFYTSADDLYDDWEAGYEFDALFLDVGFRYMTGFSLAQRVRKVDEDIPIIFVTNLDDYMQKGYEVSAYRYLRKPIQYNELFQCLDHCYQRAQCLEHNGFIIHSKGATIKLRYKDVVCIEYEAHNLNIYMRFGTIYKTGLKGAFDAFCETLPSQYFIRCHRGILINVIHVDRYTNKTIVMANGISVPISSSRTASVVECLHQFFFRERHR